MAATDSPPGSALQLLADDAEDALDRSTQEQQGQNRGDRDQGQDESIFGETLSGLISTAREQIHDRTSDEDVWRIR